jgi:hypothetical protein
MGDAEDVVKLVIRTESGITLDLDINMAAAIPLPPFQIFGERGSMDLDPATEAWRIRYRTDDPWRGVGIHEELAAPGRRYGTGAEIDWTEEQIPLRTIAPVDYYQECYEFYALDKEPYVPIEETMTVVETIQRCRDDSR